MMITIPFIISTLITAYQMAINGPYLAFYIISLLLFPPFIAKAVNEFFKVLLIKEALNLKYKYESLSQHERDSLRRGIYDILSNKTNTSEATKALEFINNKRF